MVLAYCSGPGKTVPLNLLWLSITAIDSTY
jgi:hypothetical protein